MIRPASLRWPRTGMSKNGINKSGCNGKKLAHSLSRVKPIFMMVIFPRLVALWPLYSHRLYLYALQDDTSTFVVNKRFIIVNEITA